MSMKEWLTSLIDKLVLQNLGLKDTHGNIATSPVLVRCPRFPSLTLKFATTKGFLDKNPVFVIYGTQVFGQSTIHIRHSFGNLLLERLCKIL